MQQNKNPINWFPGHMAKARRVIKESLSDVDLVIEVIDARIPYSSRNPETDLIIGAKPAVIALTKASLASPPATSAWLKYYTGENRRAVATDSLTGYGIQDLRAAVADLMSEKLERYRAKGMEGRKLRAMVIGVPNVGKSSLINRLAGGKRAKVENRPGVTLAKQWIPTEIGLDLLDMPGILWPKLGDERVAQNLAITGAIRDRILDTEDIAMVLCQRLSECAKTDFYGRYKLTPEEADGLDGYDLFNLIGKKRGMLISGGEINSSRCADMLLEEFRNGKIGRITLELPH